MTDEEEEETDIEEMAWTVVEQKSNDIRSFSEEFKGLTNAEVTKMVKSVYPNEDDDIIKDVAKKCMEWIKKGHAEDGEDSDDVDDAEEEVEELDEDDVLDEDDLDDLDDDEEIDEEEEEDDA